MPKKDEIKPKKKSVARSTRSDKKLIPSTKGYTQVDKQEEKDSFPETLLAMMGLVSSACRKANIDRSTYYAWREADPKFAADCDAIPDLIGDRIESEAFKKIQKGDSEMIRFYLKTKFKNRGFIATTEHTGANGGAIAFSNKDEDLNKLRRFNEEQLRKYIELKSILDDPITPAS